MRFLLLLVLLIGIQAQGQNLIVNPGAELPPVGNGWTQVAGFWINGTEVTAHGGLYHFYPGDNSTSGDLYQDINVSSLSTSIDAGLSTFTFTAWMRIYNAAGGIFNDEGRVVVEYRDAGSTVLGSYDSGLRHNLLWTSYTDARVAPVGTRTIRIRLLSIRNAGTASDGYFDDLSLTHVSTLPVTLLSFQASPQNEMIQVSWETSEETQNESYTLEKSLDGMNWETISVVAGAQNSGSIISYDFADEVPVTGIQYYRLLQTDLDGTTTYFPAIAVHYEAMRPVEWKVYPNPTTGKITIFTPDSPEGVVSVHSLQGQEVYQQEIGAGTTHSLDLSALGSGVYLLEYRSATTVFRQFLTKE